VKRRTRVSGRTAARRRKVVVAEMFVALNATFPAKSLVASASRRISPIRLKPDPTYEAVFFSVVSAFRRTAGSSRTLPKTADPPEPRLERCPQLNSGGSPVRA